MYNQNDIEKLFDFYDKNDKTKMICLDINLMCFNVYREFCHTVQLLVINPECSKQWTTHKTILHSIINFFH